MKKKVLMKRILTALAMAAMIPAGETWAAEFSGTEGQDDYTIFINGTFNDTYVWGDMTGVLPGYTDWHTWQYRNVSKFKNIIVNDALEVKSLKEGEGDISGTNLTITVPEGSGENSNALHISGSNTDFSVNNFTANVSAPNSGAITIDDTVANSTVTVNGKLEATVANGNGIRANASFTQDAENKIIVVGNTDITLAGGQVTYTEQKDSGDNFHPYKVEVKYNPAAVYAGNDSILATVKVPEYSWGQQTGDEKELSLGHEEQAGGQGIVELGKTTIHIGSNNYGLYAGKNGQISVGGDLDLELTSAEAENAIGIAAENSTLIYKDMVTIDGEKVTPTDTSANHSGSSVILNGDTNVINVGTNNKAIYAEGVDANGISNTVKSGDNGIGSFAITGNVAAENGGNITLEARNAESVNRLTGDLTADGVGSVYVAENEVKKQSTVDLSTNNILFIEGNAAAVNGGNVTLKGDVYSGLKGDLTADKTGSSASLEGGIVAIRGDASATNGGTVSLTANHDVSLTGNLTADGKADDGTASSASLEGNIVTMTGDAEAKDGGTVTLTAGQNADSYVSLTGNLTADGAGSSASLGGYSVAMKGDAENTVTASATNGGTVTLTAGQNADSYVSLTGNLSADGAGSSASLSGYHVVMEGNAAATDGGKVTLTAGKNAGSYVRLTGDLTADGTVSSASLEGDTFEMIGNASAINSGNVTLDSNNYGGLYGALTASGSSTAFMKSEGLNYILSQSVIDNAGGLGESAKIISALYAENGGKIDLTGSFNYIAADYSGESSENYSRRAVWAYDKADINITGGVQIEADYSAQDDPTGKNSTNMAIVAGTATGVTSENVNAEISDRAAVTVNYDSESTITGDIVSAYAGKVDITPGNSDAKINITGNLLAGNNGILNVDLGNGGTLTGRADDYGDASADTAITGDHHGDGTEKGFYNPAFSSQILAGGAVNLTMGAGSTWNVTGQSWITSIDTTAAGKTEAVLAAENPSDAIKNMATIDLVSANTDYNSTAHALTIYDMKGDAVFNMSLDKDRTLSDMLYMKHADGSYIINVNSVDLSDMYAERDNGEIFNGLRFATVGAGSNVTFRAVTVDQGVLDVEYEVGMDSYDGNDENGEYNSTATDGTASGNSEKPGDAMVDAFFKSEGTPPTDSGEESQIMLLDTADSETAGGTLGATTNFKLTGVKGTELSDAGKTVVNMSKVNYSNAVYMDRLNKRMGEARYLDGDDGLWVRLRHDRIGKDDAFRSMNTMMELGYDWKAKGQKDGEHRQGVVFDYMRGTADYTNVMGDGDVRRAGVWLYDTWLGDKGHYTDYVVKYGHLSNDFDIYAPTTLEEINGDYSNDVWSVSAEYGRKKSIGNDWYIEPQAQMQYAYVTSADYTTSQGTKVELDGIDSLIGRAGFRLGRDTSEGNTVYFKADILHEFLGDQSIRAMDKTGVLSTTYENEGTWYDVGFGFSHRMSKDSYMFLDLEHSFGNDNEDTYQINIGLSKAF